MPSAKTTNDCFGDRMKMYEAVESQRRFIPLLPVYARLDGACFSSWTKGLRRPYDERFRDLMTEVTRRLVESTNACIGYTQSDEISLVWYSFTVDSQIFMDSRIMKMVSRVVSRATGIFNAIVGLYIPEKLELEGDLMLAEFDGRAHNLPTLMEAANTILWREQDATKNSISMSARHYFSHKELHGKTGAEMHDMLFSKSVNWNDYPAYFKRGTFVQRRRVDRSFTSEELEKLPPKHEARSNPDLVVSRTEVRVIDMPPFTKVVNRVGVIFHGEDPITDYGSVNSM